MASRQIIPNFWLNGEAEEMAQFYVSAFNNARIHHTDYYTDAGKEVHGHNAGDVLTVEFEIEGQRFIALNGGPQFKINPSVSFFVNCATVEEVNDLWQKLSDGGNILMPLDVYPFSKRYGWVADKYGVGWQVTLDEADGQSSQKIITSLLFTKDVCGQAEAAIDLYTSVFPDSSKGTLVRYGEGQEPEAPDSVMYGEFTLLGQRLTAMDSARSHDFSFGEAMSLAVICDSQEEVDAFWSKLSAVPEAEACGWLRDKFGVSWQIIPAAMNDMLRNGTPEQVERVTTAFMKMKKLDVAVLQQAYNGSDNRSE